MCFRVVCGRLYPRKHAKCHYSGHSIDFLLSFKKLRSIFCFLLFFSGEFAISEHPADRMALAACPTLRTYSKLSGNQRVLIFHRIPASNTSCLGFTRNRSGRRARAFQRASQSADPSYSALSWHGPAAAAALLRAISWIFINPVSAGQNQCLLRHSLLFYYSYSLRVLLGLAYKYS